MFLGLSTIFSTLCVMRADRWTVVLTAGLLCRRDTSGVEKTSRKAWGGPGMGALSGFFQRISLEISSDRERTVF